MLPLAFLSSASILRSLGNIHLTSLAAPPSLSLSLIEVKGGEEDYSILTRTPFDTRVRSIDYRFNDNSNDGECLLSRSKVTGHCTSFRTFTHAHARHAALQGSRIRLVLGCMISPLRQHAESRNLQCVPKFLRKVKYPFSQLYVNGSQNPWTS